MAKKDPVKRIVAQILQIEDQAEKVKQEYIRGMREIIEHEQSKNMGILDKIKDLKDKEIKKMDKDTQDLLKKMKKKAKKARAEERKKNPIQILRAVRTSRKRNRR